MQNTTLTNKSIEPFCGTGDLALGLQNVDFRHTVLYEWDKDSYDNIKASIAAGFDGISDWNVYQSNVRTVSYDGLTGKINMISGGSLCQPFSLGGEAQAYNDKRDMFPEVVRAVREVMSEAFIFENVEGLLRKFSSLYFSYIILQLTYLNIVKPQGMAWEEHRTLLEQHHTLNRHEDCEYNVVSRSLNVADYGVSQLRHRMVIVGLREDVDAHWSFSNPTHFKEALLYSKRVTGDYWARHNMATPMSNPLSKQAVRSTRSAIEEYNVPSRPWQATRDVVGDLSDPQSKETTVFDNHIFRAGAKIHPGHSGSALDEPFKTIKAGVHGVPGGENMPVLDNGSVRYYTVRESARIQTFPNDHHFVAS